MRAPTAALFLTSATLASRLAPPVSVRTRSNRNGVTSRPRTPSLSASSNAVSMAAWTADPAASCSDGMGTPNTHPPSPRFRFARTIAAASSGASTLAGAAHPDVLEKNAGNSSVPYPTTAAPCVSSTSNVRGMSRMDLAPAQTTATGVRPSSVRSAETSRVCSPPRWTPPTPPVTNTSTPARCARSMVAETVVAPVARLATMGATSRRDTLAARAPASARARRWLSSRPTVGTPSIMATVAGTAPLARTTDSTSRAISRFRGYGIPWETIVLSSATTARPAARAAATSGWTTTASRPAEGVAEVTASRGEEALRWSAMDAARRAARPSIAREDVTACVGTRARSALCRRRGSGGPCRRAETSSGVQPTK